MSRLLEAPKDAMRFYIRGIVYMVDCRDIVYMETQNRYVQVHTTGRPLFVPYLRLCECLEQSDGRFLRCHRSILVNPSYIEDIQLNRKRIILCQGRGELAIGRKYEGEVRRLFDVGGKSQYTKRDI